MIIVQVILTMLLFLGTQLIYSKKSFTYWEDIFFLTQIAILWSIFLYKLRLGIIFREKSFFKGFRDYLVTIFFGISLFYIEIKFFPLIRDTGHSLKFIVIFGIFDLLFLSIFKLVFYHSMHYIRSKGHNTRHIIIIADSGSASFVDFFIKSKDWGYNLIAVLTKDSKFKNKFDHVRMIRGDIDLKDFITKNPIDDIFYCLPIGDKGYDIEQLIRESDEIGVTVHIMEHDIIEDELSNSKNLKFNFVTHSTVSHNYFYLKLKDLSDIILSTLALVLASPFIILIALMIKMEDGGPVFFKQERIGLNGRRFTFYKFRSMVVNAENLINELHDKNEADGPVFKIENDPRITKIGRFLRKTSLDELPQFYNVIKGEMSVVGPRPPLLREVKQYERSQLRRLSMKPGITGSWQVWGRHQVSFDEWMRMDLDYIDNWSLLLDFKIILATVTVIIKANGQ